MNRFSISREPSRAPRHLAFPYQAIAVEALREREFAAVFHEQGLGKTKIALDLALAWLDQDVVDSILIVTKKSLVENWVGEVIGHTYYKPRVFTQDRADNYYTFNTAARFYVAHYEFCVAEHARLALFARTRRLAVFCDEAQKFKNPDSKIADVLFRLREAFSRRVVLTGTPIANRPPDIWSLIYFLDGGKSLGADFVRFRAEFDLTNDAVRDPVRREKWERSLAALWGKINNFTIRETKESAGIRLPEKSIRTEFAEMEDRQAELYAAIKSELAAIVVREGIPTLDRADTILKRLLRLVQIASNPKLVDATYTATPGKLPVLEDIVDQALRSNSGKIIVWSTFTDNVDWLANALGRWGTVKVHGRMTISERNSSIRDFKNDDDTRILVATPGAAKEGLTLTVANQAVFFDRSFSLDDYLQAQDRIHRISQTEQCIVHNIQMRGTVDEWIDALLSAKRLAAQLGLGDIDPKEYRARADYHFAEMIKEVLDADR